MSDVIACRKHVVPMSAQTQRKWWIGAWSLLIGVCWIFPTIWFTKSADRAKQVWIVTETNVPGWTCSSTPVTESIERILVADEVFAGAFTNEAGGLIRVFSANRYKDQSNEIGLFVHTPDRCWTEAGWELETAEPETKSIVVGSITLIFERRVFRFGSIRELVYFGGLTSGQVLPFRLDHNFSVGLKMKTHADPDSAGTSARASDRRYWGRVWDTFESRISLQGAKQFLRISTPIAAGDVGRADDTLVKFIADWLTVQPYVNPISSWPKPSRINRTE